MSFPFHGPMKQSYIINWVKDLIWDTWRSIIWAIKIHMFPVCGLKGHSPLPEKVFYVKNVNE